MSIVYSKHHHRSFSSPSGSGAPQRCHTVERASGDKRLASLDNTVFAAMLSVVRYSRDRGPNYLVLSFLASMISATRKHT